MKPLRSLPSPGRRGLFPALALALAFAGSGCSRKSPDTFQGYIEGEYVQVASPVAGAVVELRVARGDSVKAGDSLFVLEAEAERAALEEAERRVRAINARLDDLRKGMRPSELAAREARAGESRANRDWWKAELSRREQLFRDQVISAAELDQARSQADAAQAAFAADQAELATARLGAREDEIRAAEADQQALLAAVAQARWTLDQKAQRAPHAGVVHDVLFRQGEFVPAGTPVVSLLPPENLRARFFVPQDRLPSLAPGASVEVLRDGADGPVQAVINYISTQAEFTPPVIFGRETRARLVFMIEASFAPGIAAQLRPGQPVDVRLP